MATKKNLTLNDLDKMDVCTAQKLPFAVRDKLLDLMMKDSRKVCGKQPARQVGLMCDYFEEDLARYQKVKAIRVRCGGFIPVAANGEVPTLDPKGQFKLVFENIKKALKIAGTSIDRIANMVIFMKNMDYWAQMNEVYRLYVKCSPTRAAIGCQDLNKEYQIEVINILAYKVAK
ncbi:MAG: RidA family protein [Candidatus Anammoxibacter sp.]